LDSPLPPAPSVAFDDLGHLIPIIPLHQTEEESTEDGKGKQKALNYFSPPEVIEQPTWADIAIKIGAELMQKCRDAVRQQLGYTCSAGIARNKVRH